MQKIELGPPSRVERIAEMFHLLGNPRRIVMLAALRDGPKTHKDLAVSIDRPFKDVTYDLYALSDAWAIERSGGRGCPWSLTPYGEALLAAYTLLAHVQPRPRLESVTTPEARP
jgi:predicted transcriptional regulator